MIYTPVKLDKSRNVVLGFQALQEFKKITGKSLTKIKAGSRHNRAWAALYLRPSAFAYPFVGAVCLKNFQIFAERPFKFSRGGHRRADEALRGAGAAAPGKHHRQRQIPDGAGDAGPARRHGCDHPRAG